MQYCHAAFLPRKKEIEKLQLGIFVRTFRIRGGGGGGGDVQQVHNCSIDVVTNFMHTILTKVVPDHLKACLRFV